MSVQGRGDLDCELRPCGLDFFDEVGEVALKVQAEGEEIRDYQNSGCAAIDELIDRGGKVGLSTFEKAGAYEWKLLILGNGSSHDADCFIRTFYAGTVGEDHYCCSHTFIVANYVSKLVLFGSEGTAGEKRRTASRKLRPRRRWLSSWSCIR